MRQELKFNVDVVLSGSQNIVAVAVACRVRLSLSWMGVSLPATLEAITCIEALASDMNTRHATITSDCLGTIRNLKELNLCSYGAILQEINVRATMLEDARFKHERCNAIGA